MAKPTPRGGRGQPARAAAKSKKAATAEVESTEDAPGIGIESGLTLLTLVALIAALLLVDMIQAKNGDGIFF
jgi:hypothetical protein